MKVRDLGLIDYSEALKKQDAAVQAVTKNKSEEIILVCEHDPVITVGRARGARDEVFATEIPVFEVPRGGRATLHLPGQVVVYPILNLDERGRDLHSYMRLLEKSIIDTLGDFRLKAVSIPEKTGVWIIEPRRGGGEKKIASIGIAVKHWVSYHGLALNVDCDLGMFHQLSPCGFSPEVMTSIFEELPREYIKTWGLTPEGLFTRVKTRLVENLESRLKAGLTSQEASDL